MIKRYSDHAANERTFLAWVRTAIAVMAFGFLIERFDLFLRFARPALTNNPSAAPGEGFANAAGLAFLLLGVAMIAIAAWRYFRTAKQIDSEENLSGPGDRLDLALAALLVLLGCSLFLYLSHAVVEVQHRRSALYEEIACGHPHRRQRLPCASMSSRSTTRLDLAGEEQCDRGDRQQCPDHRESITEG
jgi:putative membrane protein